MPDGDTGINMSLTMHMAAKEVRETQPQTVSQVADAVALGSLKGRAAIPASFSRRFSAVSPRAYPVKPR